MSMPDPIVLLDARARYVHPAFQMSRASTKTVFDAAGRLATVPPNAIGWDHDPATGQSRGYLAEPSATNLLLHSNDLTQGAWNKDAASIEPGAITGPDGSAMSKLVEDTTSAQHRVLQVVSISAGDAVVGRCIAKAGERPAVRLLLGDGASTSNYISVVADLDLGVLRSASESGDALLEGYGVVPIGDGFCLVWVAGTLGAGATSARFQVSLSNADGSVAYEGDGTSGLYLGYFQLEEGKFATSYIETGGATATRAGDGLTCSTSSLPWRNNRGAVVIDADIGWWLQGAVLFSWGNDVVARTSSNDRLTLIGANLSGNKILASSLGKLRLAIAWDADEVNAAANGSLISSPLLITSPLSSGSIGVGCRFTGVDPWTGPVHRAVYYPARLSNADLQSLTAIQE